MGEALRVYTKLQSSGRKFVTLRSCNVGFPPPEKYQPGYIMVKNPKWKPKQRGKKREKKFIEKRVVPMNKLNRRGIFWCPYCREMRKFQTQGGFFLDSAFVPDERGLYCPIDGTSYRDYHVRKWNPVAEIKWAADQGKRKARGKKRKSASGSRSKRRR